MSMDGGGPAALRRSRLRIRSFQERLDSYEAGVDVGDMKYNKKKPIMKTHYLGVARLTAKANEIVSSVLDEAGIVGPLRGVYQGAALRLARFMVKYRRVGEDRLRALTEAFIAEQAATTGFVPGSDDEREFIDIMRQIRDRFMNSLDELEAAYRSGYMGEIKVEEQAGSQMGQG